MAFRKNFTVYKKAGTHVYINQCHNKGKTTKLYALRRDDKTGCGHLLGLIKWDGGWWQYVLDAEHIRLSAGCMRNIADFCDQITKKQKQNWGKNRG